MEIGFIHLSDIHLRETGNYINKKLGKLQDAVLSDLYGLERIFLIVSGDIAYSGNHKEFEVGFDILSELIAILEEKTKLMLNVIIIPGNHDCDFSGNLVVRNNLLDILDSSNLEEEIVNEICKPLDSYYEFEAIFQNDENIVFKDRLFKQLRFEIDGYSIQFNCLNTPWVSLRKELPGKMIFPLDKYKNYLENSADLSISLMHHPSHWLHPNRKRQVDELLKSNSDMVVTGHEHTITNSINLDFNDNRTIYLEGSALQTNDSEESIFSIFKIDMKTKLLSKNDFHWKDNYYYKEEVIKDKEIDISKTFKRNKIKNNFLLWLNDLGISIKHPRLEENAILNDLYVFPNAKYIRFDEQKENKDKDVSLSKFVKLDEHKKIFIAGQENYGKTSFCKKVFEASYKKGHIPIYISGRMLRSSNLKDFMKTLSKQFMVQYDEESPGQFEQMDKDQVTVIIDDIDKSALNVTHRNLLISNINRVYTNLVITASELTKFPDLISDVDHNHFEGFIKLEMLAFGHRLRGELIEKWNRIGSLQTRDESELIKNIDKNEKTVSAVIGNNFIPSVPFFILVILQTEESNQSNLRESAYGYYYEYLISQSLMNIKLKNEDIDAFNNYISHLSYSYFKDKVFEKSRRELLVFHQDYCLKYDLTIEFSEYEKKLIEASIIIKVGENYLFKYKYIFYYFVAKYLSIRMMIGDEEIKDIIKSMCNKLYIEEYSNIIMFLSHLSKNPIILNGVLESSRYILNEFEHTKLENDIQSFNELITTIPRMVIDHKDTLENRQVRQSAIDEMERAHIESSSSTEGIMRIEEEDHYEQFDIISKINWATKNIEIMGQILKSYYGSTPAKDKLLLGEEIFLLSMRALNTFLKTFSDNKENLLKEIERVIMEKNIDDDDDEKVSNISRKFVFNLMTAISHYFIKKVSISVGTLNLEDTFFKILEQNDLVSFKLIDLSIKLDHGHAIPFRDIERFVKDLPETNYLALHILRMLAVEHMYMFYVDFKDRDKLIGILELSDTTRQKISLSSTKRLN
ncbi:STAND family AAA ATPase [Sporosarcina highlanderae]|uniref:Metallophosphoesterase n=1 Tax=Sporosarcina highlanderae TaxID=3035916 RepID=A0ABT8JQE5_9BACL|nr:metallophosphoesterase [Sporosarcina highlanderae]MDN4607177.1 metallophosphoesterase [Sporosarcina highlanderae]